MSRILIMVHNLTGGGAERVAALWANGFVHQGHEIGIVLNCKESEAQTYELHNKVKCYNINNWFANKLYRYIKIDSLYIIKLKRIINDFQPDLMIGVMAKWSVLAKRSTQGKNIPVINTEHNVLDLPVYAPEKRKNNLKWRFKKYGMFDHITVLTEADKLLIRNYKNVSVLPNPLAFTPLKTLPSKENVILAVGRLDVWHIKGFDILIKAWGGVASFYPKWKLQIAGGGNNKSLNYLKSLAVKYQLDEQIEFLGFQQNIQPFYQKASVFILSSRYEGFGMALIEAMSQGCAPIACDYKGRQKEIITSEQEGIICPIDDENALSVSVCKMLSDDEYRMNVQYNAIQRSKYYSLDNIMDRWNKIIKEL